MSLFDASGIVEPWIEFEAPPQVDPNDYRRALSHFASGVVVLTSVDPNGDPAGMTCQSFTSLSLNPPLILVAPAMSSRSWPVIAASNRFAVNVLGADQREDSGAFARSGADKFAGAAWHLAESGLPLLDKAIATIECVIAATHAGGDHWIVTGAVTKFTVKSEDPQPLLFYRSGYHTLASDEENPGRH